MNFDFLLLKNICSEGVLIFLITMGEGFCLLSGVFERRFLIINCFHDVKLQICMKLSLLASLPTAYGGLNGHVIYIDVESKFSSKR